MALVERAEELAQVFGLGPGAVLSGPVAAGKVGRVWRLDTAYGSWAVKESSAPPDLAAVADQAAYQELVAAAGVPTPTVVRTTAGAVYADVDGHPVRAYGWVNMAEVDRGLDPAAVGGLIAAVHAVRVPAVGAVDPWFSRPVGTEAWGRTVERLEEAGAPFASRLAALLPELAAVEALVEPVAPTQLCHLDLFADNVRATPDGGLCVFDWDNAGPGDPAQEVALALLEFGWEDPDRQAELYAGYRAAGGPARVRGTADFTLAVACLGHITAEGCRRWLADDSLDSRAENAAWVSEFLDEPLTVAVIEETLAGVVAQNE